MSNWIDIMGWPTSDRAGDPDTFIVDLEKVEMVQFGQSQICGTTVSIKFGGSDYVSIFHMDTNEAQAVKYALSAYDCPDCFDVEGVCPKCAGVNVPS